MLSCDFPGYSTPCQGAGGITDERNSAGPAEERTTSTAPEMNVAAVARSGRCGLVLLPDTISLVAGCFSFLSAVDGHIVRGAIMIAVSLVCDGLDGLVARASRATSAFGLEYDSLSDVIAFGVYVEEERGVRKAAP